MKENFWIKLKKPIFALAPMDDVTDAPFRAMIQKYGKPDVMWTEFISADGLVNSVGRKALERKLIFSKKEKPIVAQLFGANPENVKTASKFVAELGFDGIDINMGCPDRKIEKIGAGASLIKNPELAKEIIAKVKEGVPDLPVSVKTRIGYKSESEFENWINELLSANPAVITIHLRTRNEMSKVPAKFEFLKKAVQIRDKSKSKTLIIGNGDILNRKQGEKIAKQTGADGVMIGRGFFGKPWLLSKRFKKEPTPKKKLQILLEHTKLFEKTFKAKNKFAVMKKHFKSYCSGFRGAKEIRVELMGTVNSKEVKKVVDKYLKKM